jgi:hypothetical protein
LDATFLLAINFFFPNTKVSCVCVFQFIMILTVIIQWISMEHRTNDTDKEKVKYSEKIRPSVWTSAGRGQQLTPSAMVRPAEHAKLNFGAYTKRVFSKFNYSWICRLPNFVFLYIFTPYISIHIYFVASSIFRTVFVNI